MLIVSMPPAGGQTVLPSRITKIGQFNGAGSGSGFRLVTGWIPDPGPLRNDQLQVSGRGSAVVATSLEVATDTATDGVGRLTLNGSPVGTEFAIPWSRTWITPPAVSVQVDDGDLVGIEVVGGNTITVPRIYAGWVEIVPA